MEEKNFSGQESLHLIQQMIRVAKEDHQENGDGWLIWGWLLFAASISSMLLYWFGDHNYIGWIWLGVLAIGLLYTLAKYLPGNSRRKRSDAVKTYIQELLGRFTTGFFISLFVMIAANYMINSSFAFGYFYVLYAFWMFIHGSAIRFRPLLIGAVVNWAAAIAIFIINDFGYDMLVSSIAILTGYLIPGYMLRTKYRKAKLL